MQKQTPPEATKTVYPILRPIVNLLSLLSLEANSIAAMIPFYSPRHQQRLEQIKTDFDNGRRNYHPHELIEESARGKALA